MMVLGGGGGRDVGGKKKNGMDLRQCGSSLACRSARQSRE